MNPSQEKINQFSSLALESDPSTVIDLWKKELDRRIPVRHEVLSLFYVCNDILQLSMRNSELHTLYNTAFASVLPASFQAAVKHNPSLKQSLQKILKIWKDRAVCSAQLMRKLKRALQTGSEDSE